MDLSKNRIAAKKHDVELMMLRQLAEYLNLPVFVFDVFGNLIFYNQFAETIIDFKFSERGEISLKEWPSFFIENKRSRYSVKNRILAFDLKTKQPFQTSQDFHVKSKGSKITYQIFTIPLMTKQNHLIGAAAFFKKYEALWSYINDFITFINCPISSESPRLSVK